MNTDKQVMIAAGVGVIGVLVGSLISGIFAYQTSQSLVDIQRATMRSEASLKLLEYRSKAYELITVARSKMNAGKPGDVELDDAAMELGRAAAMCAARFGESASRLCLELQVSANRFAKAEQPDSKKVYQQEIFDKLEKIERIYRSSQETYISEALGSAH
ncbi:hypothetical protein ACYZUD_10735 [Pseudomonas sp. XS1P51]